MPIIIILVIITSSWWPSNHLVSLLRRLSQTRIHTVHTDVLEKVRTEHIKHFDIACMNVFGVVQLLTYYVKCLFSSEKEPSSSDAHEWMASKYCRRSLKRPVLMMVRPTCFPTEGDDRHFWNHTLTFCIFQNYTRSQNPLAIFFGKIHCTFSPKSMTKIYDNIYDQIDDQNWSSKCLCCIEKSATEIN